ncbi:TPA: hypothetical protein ACU9QB_005897, partial [Pseudomonas aeruginosa]
ILSVDEEDLAADQEPEIAPVGNSLQQSVHMISPKAVRPWLPKRHCETPINTQRRAQRNSMRVKIRTGLTCFNFYPTGCRQGPSAR